MDNEELRDLPSLLYQLMRLHFGVAQRCLEKQGLHRAQPGIIKHLSEEDGQTQVELANKMTVTPATISAMLKRMERDELVYRKRSHEDQRVTHVYLTEKGKMQSAKIREAFNQINQRCFRNFSDEELDQAQLIFKKMIQNFKEEGKDAENI